MSQDRNSSPQLPLRPGLIALVVGLAFAFAMLTTPLGFGQEGDKTKDKNGDKKDAKDKKNGNGEKKEKDNGKDDATDKSPFLRKCPSKTLDFCHRFSEKRTFVGGVNGKDKAKEKDKKEKPKVTPKEAKEFAVSKSMRIYFKEDGLESVNKFLVGAKLKVEKLAALDDYFVVEIPKDLRKDEEKALEKLAELLTKIRREEYVLKIIPDRMTTIDFGRHRVAQVQYEPCPICPPSGCRPNDPLFFKQWDMENIRAPKAWCAVRTSPVVVAVIDSGIDYGHPDLIDNLWENPNPGGFQLTEKQIDDEIDVVKMGLSAKREVLKAIFKGVLISGNDKHGVSLDEGITNLKVGESVFPLPVPVANKDASINDFTTERNKVDNRFISHGTKVAGIIGAVGNNRTGISGVSPNVKIMSIKVFPKSRIDPKTGLPKAPNGAIIGAMIYAKLHGAKVINFSLGGPGNPGDLDFSYRWVLSYLDNSGILVVASAGNGDPDTNIGYNTDKKPAFPASFPHLNVISVANLTQAEVLDTSSNFGKRTVHIAAPGTGSFTTFPRGTGTTEKDYGEFGGTSAAAPHVAGAAALLWGHPKYAAMNHHAIKAQLLDNARLLNSLIGKCRTEGTLDLSFMCREGCQDVYPFHTGPFAPAPVTAKMAGMAMAPGTLKLTVPADAKVFLDDRQTTSTGVDRVFTTPPLTKGYTYSYEARVEVDHQGTTLRNVRSVQIQGGVSTSVTLDLPTLKSLAQMSTK